MRRLRLLAAAGAVGLAALALAACGGGGGGEGGSTQGTTTSGGSSEPVPADAVAVVGGTPILRTQLEHLLTQTAAYYESQGQTFPAKGTPDYTTAQQQALNYLVQRVEVEQAAKELGITIDDKAVDASLEQLKQSSFGGDEAALEKALEQAKLTVAEERENLRFQLTAEGVVDKLTKEATAPTEADAQAYYDSHKSDYQQEESREVAHILVATEKKANDIYAQLQDGADFATLAKKYSTDTGSAADGGKLTAVKGQLVAPFEKVAFALDTGTFSKPVKSEYGWHIIEALGDVQPAGVQPFDQVQDSILSQLEQEQQTTIWNKWLDKVTAQYAGRVSYAKGFEPPAETDAGSTAESGASTGAGTTSP